MAKWWRTHSLRYDGRLGLYYDFYDRKRFPWGKLAIGVVIACLLALTAYKEFHR